MGTWDNRVWQCSNDAGTWYEVRETYYNKTGEICACTEGASTARSGDSLDDLAECLEMMQVAVEMAQSGVPVLVEEGFVFAKWDE